jgi:hypothetical protein
MLGACAALALAGCGSSSDEPEGDPLPADAVAQLQVRLDEIERRYRDAVDNGNVGACKDIGRDSLRAVRKVIAGLPDSVDPDLRSALKASFARLGELAENECADIEPEPEPVPEEPVPEEPIPEETVPEETVPEETVPEETIPEETVPEEPVPPGDGDGNGGGVEAPPGLEKKD